MGHNGPFSSEPNYWAFTDPEIFARNKSAWFALIESAIKARFLQNMKHPSRHSSFFSSLRQVEKRLKLELPSHSSNPSPPQPPEVDSLSSPIFVHSCQPTTTNNEDPVLQDSSEPPLAFLSPSPQFPPTQQNSYVENPQIGPKVHTDDVDDIELLIRLLGLSEEEEKLEQRKSGGCCNYADSCGYEDVFYKQIVGVKGPKCRKQVERMDGWIRYLSNGGDGGGEGNGSSEPLRLAFLLVGKAAFLSEGCDGLEFPSAIEEFLKTDPPMD